MLPKEENELITRTDAGTPMGDLMRRYWLPALLIEEIPEPDSAPVQVRLLGEHLVAFRDSQGRIGLLDEHCAHRGTSLFYGRNEECGLRCIYHGWKYDVDGNVLDTPAEPTDSSFKQRVRQRAYPCHEVGGVVFAYMGPPETQPLFPNYAWTQVPTENTYVTKCLLECNYLQGLEGECDSAHLSYLHRSLDATGLTVLSARDGQPKYETEDTDFGVRLLAFRNPEPGQVYLRVSSFVMPVSCWVPAGGGREIHMYVPATDTTAWRIDLGFRKDRPPLPEEVHRRRQIDADYRRVRNMRNHYLQDREIQKTRTFTGIEDFLNHDACATETMGPIFDRSREHLGLSDKGVIAVRRFLLEAARGFGEGQEPPHVVTDPAQNNFSHVDTVAKLIPDEGHWRDHLPYLTLTSSGGTVAPASPAR